MTTDQRVIKLVVTGMSCSGCSSRVQKSLQSVPGVKSATVNLDSSIAVIETMPDGPSADDLVAAVEKVGYSARAVD